MPIPTPVPPSRNLFPLLAKSDVEASRLSSWYSTFRDITIASIIVDLDSIGEKEAFIEVSYLCHQVRNFVDDVWQCAAVSSGEQPAVASTSTSRPRSTSSASSSSSSTSSSIPPKYHLPKLNAAIRGALTKYNGAVFPKLNWTSPKDASFILPQTSHGPLYSTTPADVYLLLKSSDFVSFDVDPERVYCDCDDAEGDEELKIELVLRNFVQMNPSRELRCFVRDNRLIGISQRDLNYYDHFQSLETRQTICDSVRALWEDEIRLHYAGGEDYVFDLYLSTSFESATIIDFQPYRPSTDALLFEYSELLSILQEANQRLPVFKVVDSKSHPAVNLSVPNYQSNMMPVEMIEMSQGRSMGEFREAWEEAVANGMRD
ncbi:hypothetical protein P7C73_g418, partial [Tremellales sp. Uapishka_1]